MKKVLLCLMVLFMISGCSVSKIEEIVEDAGNVVEDITDGIIDNVTESIKIEGDVYTDTFNKGVEEGKSVEEIANDLCAIENDLNLVTMEVEEGYLNGFFTEVYGFNKGQVVSPMIGSIPFIIYVFETDDVKNLSSVIEDSKDMRWNICTEADRYLIIGKEDKVFFMMYSTES